MRLVKRFLVVALVALMIAGSLLYYKLQPSADMHHFEKYFAQNEIDSAIKPGQVKVTFFGTSTLLFDDGETQLLIDGFFSRPGFYDVVLGEVKSDTSLIRSMMADHHINRLKAIFTSHSHYDHAMDAPFVASLTGATVYGSSSTLNICKGANLPEAQTSLFEPGKEIALGKFGVTVIKSKHSPPFTLLGKTNATDPRHPDITEPLKQPAKVDDYIEGGAYDFYVRYEGHAALVKASTNYIPGALTQYPADVIFLGAALLGVQADTFQNNYYLNTVQAINAKTVIPVHWDNFTKPLSQPLEALPNLSDDMEKGLNFLVRSTAKDGRTFKILGGSSSIVLF
jgi:L-ascorbate metabolism protein UlaG (beta-lactamase superfamily)